MHIVVVATAWGAAEGGINAFNQAFAIGLAQAGGPEVQVLCAIPGNYSDADERTAAAHGVRLVPVSGKDGRPIDSCGKEVLAWLREQGGDETISAWVGHDVITGPVAVAAANEVGGCVALIHHMDYASYQNIGGGAGPRAARNEQRQIELFSTPEAVLFGVGTALTRSATLLGGRKAHQLVPGFPEERPPDFQPGDGFRILAAGRFDNASERLKQSRLVAAAAGRAVKLAHGLPTIDALRLTILGVDRQRCDAAELEDIARREAGREITVIPVPFTPDPARVMALMRRADLAIMPSYTEGFGLIGWEAIGSKVPLILSRRAGLHGFIQDVLGGAELGCLQSLDLHGGDCDERDVAAMGHAILRVARDRERARRDAKILFDQLRIRVGATWLHCARDFLEAMRESGMPLPERHDQAGAAGAPSFALHDDGVFGAPEITNTIERCAELEIASTQGCRPARFDVLVTLRFGPMPFSMGRHNVDIRLARATLQISSEHGRLVGRRHGDPPRSVPGIRPLAGGIWQLSDPSGQDVLPDRALFNEVLCEIETPPGAPAHVRAQLTAAAKDFRCSFSSPETQNLSKTTTRVIETFLKKAVLEPVSGHVVLSDANLRAKGAP